MKNGHEAGPESRSQPDITLRQSEERYRRLVEYSPQGILVHCEGRIAFVNRAGAQLLGAGSPEDLIGSPGIRFVRPGDRPAMRKRIDRIINRGLVLPSIEGKLIRLDGAEIDIEAAEIPTVHNGKPAVQVVFQDITERNRAQRALKESEDRYRDLVENSHDLICTHDLEGRILSANRAAARSLGYEPKYYVNRKNIRDIIAPEYRNQFDDYLERIRKNGADSGLMVVVAASGERRIWEYNNTLRTDGSMVVRGIAHDITERKRAEQALRRREELFRALIENTSDGIAMVSEDGEALYASPSALRIMGYSESEMAGPSAFEFLHPDDLERATRGFFKLLKTPGGITSGEYRARRKDGSWIWIECVNQNLLDHPNVGAIVCNFRDITERKRTQEALRLSEERFALFMKHLPSATWMKDTAGRYVYANERAEQVFNRKLRDLLGKTDDEVFPPSVAAEFKRNDRSVITSRRPLQTIESLPKTDGLHHSIVSKFPILDEAGTPLMVAGVAIDITERERAEEALRESQQRLKEQLAELNQLYSTAPVGLALLDRNLRFIRINERLAAMIGGLPGEHVGRTLREVIPELAWEVETTYARVLDSDDPILGLEIRQGDPERCWLVSFYPLRSDRGSVQRVSMVVDDITERKQAEQALKNFSRRLIEAQETERRHIARELHDEIGQTLTALKIEMQSMRRSGAPFLKEARLDECLGIVAHALQQVRDLSFDLRPSLLDDLGLVAALRWYLDRLSQRVGFGAQFIADSLDMRLPPEIETACFRVAQEALTNVVRHAGARSVAVELKHRAGRLSLVIRDDGVGFNARGVSQRNLGLQGMQERALAVGGQIDIKSAAGRGTEIKARFPLARALSSESSS